VYVDLSRRHVQHMFYRNAQFELTNEKRHY